jgi:hypothetical protein
MFDLIELIYHLHVFQLLAGGREETVRASRGINHSGPKTSVKRS